MGHSKSFCLSAILEPVLLTKKAHQALSNVPKTWLMNVQGSCAATLVEVHSKKNELKESMEEGLVILEARYRKNIRKSYPWYRSKTDDIENKDNREELMARSEMGLPNSPEDNNDTGVPDDESKNDSSTLEDDWVSSDEESGDEDDYGSFNDNASGSNIYDLFQIRTGLF